MLLTHRYDSLTYTTIKGTKQPRQESNPQSESFGGFPLYPPTARLCLCPLLYTNYFDCQDKILKNSQKSDVTSRAKLVAVFGRFSP
jgi:hypothetical protein